VGGSYSVYARISALSGQPAVLGWIFTRCSGAAARKRLFTSCRYPAPLLHADLAEAQDIMAQYSIRYIFIGNLERTTYTFVSARGLNEAKFMRFLSPVFKQVRRLSMLRRKSRVMLLLAGIILLLVSLMLPGSCRPFTTNVQSGSTFDLAIAWSRCLPVCNRGMM